MPCDFETARTETMTLLNDKWVASVAAAVPITWPNVKKKKSGSQQGTTNDAPAWARFTMQYASGEGRSIGAGLWRLRGIIRFEIYVPQGENDRLALQYAKIAANAFRKKTTASGVSFFNVRPEQQGNDSLWYRVDVLSEFQHDEVV